MKILKKLCAVVLSGCLFLCGSGFSNNKYESVQTIELKSDLSTGFVWNVEVVNLNSPKNQWTRQGEDENIEDKKDDNNENEEEKDNVEKKHMFKAGEVEISHDFKSDNEDPTVCGEEGTDVFTIRGKKEGMVVLAFECKKCGSEEREENDRDQKCVKEVAAAVIRVNEEKKIKIVGYAYIDVDELNEYMKSFGNIEKDKRLFLKQACLR